MAIEYWPDVAVCIPTYNRARIVCDTVALLFAHLNYPGFISIFVGCDGVDNTGDALRSLDVPAQFGLYVLDAPAGGIGRNLNRLLRHARGHRIDFYITMDDDHHLIAPLDLRRHVQKLKDDTGAGRIHLLMEAVHDEHYDHYKFVGTLDKHHYWRVHWDSPEHFIMSFRPNLTHYRWWEIMGYLPEGLTTGATEWQYAHHCKDIGRLGGGVDVFVPLCAYGYQHWAHNNGGISWNRQGL